MELVGLKSRCHSHLRLKQEQTITTVKVKRIAAAEHPELRKQLQIHLRLASLTPDYTLTTHEYQKKKEKKILHPHASNADPIPCNLGRPNLSRRPRNLRMPSVWSPAARQETSDNRRAHTTPVLHASPGEYAFIKPRRLRQQGVGRRKNLAAAAPLDAGREREEVPPP